MMNQNFECDILFIDNHLLAINKPAGLLTQPSGTAKDNLETRAKAWIKAHTQKTGNIYLHAVHRLDAPVSGIVLFARTSKALSRLNTAIRERNTKKTYLAIVSRSPSQEEGFLEHFLLHDAHASKIVTKNRPGAQLARLKYRILAKANPLALLEVWPETGRYHQIRVQLAAMGAPILGDQRYGGLVWPEGKGKIALHHHRLELRHPVGEQQLVVEAPPPTNWPALYDH